VVVMNGGRIEQIGAPNDLYHSPRTRFVASFIGSPAMNMIPCRLEAQAGGLSVRLSDRLALPLPAGRGERYKAYAGKELLFGLRPEHIVENRGNGSGAIDAVPFSVMPEVVEPMGMETLVYFTIDGTEVCGRVNPASNPQAGAPMALMAELGHMHLIDPASDLVI